MKAYYKGKTRTVKTKNKRISFYLKFSPQEFITRDNKKLKTSDNKKFIAKGKVICQII